MSELLWTAVSACCIGTDLGWRCCSGKLLHCDLFWNHWKRLRIVQKFRNLKLRVWDRAPDTAWPQHVSTNRHHPNDPTQRTRSCVMQYILSIRIWMGSFVAVSLSHFPYYCVLNKCKLLLAGLWLCVWVISKWMHAPWECFKCWVLCVEGLYTELMWYDCHLTLSSS